MEMLSQHECNEHGSESSDEVETTKELEETQAIDALVVFGFGIKSDRNLDEMGKSRQIAIEGKHQPWRLPLGAKLRTVAAAEVYLTGQVKDVIFTGGSVKQKEGVSESEAELMEEYFIHILTKRKKSELRNNEFLTQEQKEAGLDEFINNARSHIKREDKATNTIENFSNTINLIHNTNYSNVALLSSNFHLKRIMLLAQKHGVGGYGIGADDVVAKKRVYQRIVDHHFDLEGNKKFRDEVLSDFRDQDEIDDIEEKYGPSYGYFMTQEERKIEKRLGTSAEEYARGERRWIRGLEEMPEYWMQGLQYIQDPQLLRGILQAEVQVQSVLREKFGITDIDEASIEEIKKALSETERRMPPEEWGNKN